MAGLLVLALVVMLPARRGHRKAVGSSCYLLTVPIVVRRVYKIRASGCELGRQLVYSRKKEPNPMALPSTPPGGGAFAGHHECPRRAEVMPF